MLQYVCLLKSRNILLPDKYDGFSSDWLIEGRVGHTASYVALYMIKKSTIDLICFANDISNCGQAYVWSLKSPTFLLPDIYDGLSADSLRLESRSRWQ